MPSSAQDDTHGRNLRVKVGSNASPKFFILKNGFFPELKRANKKKIDVIVRKRCVCVFIRIYIGLV